MRVWYYSRYMKYVIIVLLSLFIFSSVTSVSYAQTITLSATDSAVATAPAIVQYDFPYPGILPDHPLYFIKIVRDRVVGFLINDLVKKAEFNLLQSDKRISAAQMLFDKESDQLGVDTLSKSNNYMHNAISVAKKAEKANLPTEAVVGKIGVSISKHEEVMKSLIASNNPEKDSLKAEYKRLESIKAYYKKSFSKK